MSGPLAWAAAWAGRSLEQLRRAAESEGRCAEVSVGLRTLGEAGQVLADAEAAILPIPHRALFRAGRAFRDDRRRSGTRTGVLPDSLVGAHAGASGLRLPARDGARHRSACFPTPGPIAP